jgi:hypothetical protein
MRDEPDLDFLISTIRHIVATRNITSNYQVGGWLLTGLERSLGYGLLRMIGMLSPAVIQAIVDENVLVLQRQAIEARDPIFAANLCLSLTHQDSEFLVTAAMDSLWSTHGKVLNQYVPIGAASSAAEPWSHSRQLSSLPEQPRAQREKPLFGKKRGVSEHTEFDNASSDTRHSAGERIARKLREARRMVARLPQLLR